MKIAMVTPYDWNIPGGVNQHASHLTTHLRRAGQEVTIFAPASDPDAARGECVPMGRTIPVRSSGSVQRISPGLRSGSVRRVLDEGGFDLVHVHEPMMPMLPYHFLRQSQVPVVGTFHAAREGGHRLYGLSRPLTRRLYNRLAGTIAVSPAAVRHVSRYLPGDYTIIPNGIDYPHFASCSAPLPELMDGRCNILFVGRPEKRKGLQILLRAYLGVRQRHPRATRLIVVGAGDFSRFERAMRGMDDVVFRPGVPYAELPRYHASAHVFCSPATGNESQGIALLEGMAAGLPVVASNIEGFATMVTHGREGLLVPPRESDALRDAIEALLGDRDLRERLARNATATAERYSWDHITGEVLAFYERHLPNGGRR